MTPAATTLAIIISELEDAYYAFGKAAIRAPYLLDNYRAQALSAHKRLEAYLKTVSVEDLKSL